MADRLRPALLRRLLARCWHVWGLSLCYTAASSADRSFYKAGAWSFRRAAQLWPAFAPAHYQLGLICGRELGEYRAALAHLDQASELRPDWPEPYLQRGLLHRFNGEPARAAVELRRFIELAPPGYWRDEAERQLVQLRGDEPPSAA
jgi:tetratricopeptide (TPR) repeat protein